MGFVSEIRWPEMKSIVANDNKRVRQTMLRYFKCVTVFWDKHYQNRRVRDALRIFLISQFLENDMFSIEIDPRM